MIENDDIEQTAKGQNNGLLPLNEWQFTELDLDGISMLTLYNGEAYQVEEVDVENINRTRTGSDTANFETSINFSSTENINDNNSSDDETNDKTDESSNDQKSSEQNHHGFKRSNNNLEQLLCEIGQAFKEEDEI